MYTYLLIGSLCDSVQQKSYDVFGNFQTQISSLGHNVVQNKEPWNLGW